MAEINLAKTQKKQLKLKRLQESPNLVAKKHFGQNFLVNLQVQKKVIQNFQKLQREFARLSGVLEIGPGQGHLTEYLLVAASTDQSNFKAVEIDPESVNFLENKFDQNFWSNLSASKPGEQVDSEAVLTSKVKIDPSIKNPNSEILSTPEAVNITSSQLNIAKVESSSDSQDKFNSNKPENNHLKEVASWLVLGDALELTAKGQLPIDNFVLFASLPYNVGSRILVDLAVNYPHCPFCVIVQKEVATKVDRSFNFTLLGAFLSLFYSFERAFDIAGGSFQPVPKVTSSLLVGRPKLDFNSKQTKLDPDQKNLSQKLDQASTSNNSISQSILNLNPNLILAKTENRQKILQVLKSLFGMPSKTLANNLKSLGWDKTKIDQFINQNNYQNVRLTWDNYESILWQIWPWLEG